MQNLLPPHPPECTTLSPILAFFSPCGTLTGKEPFVDAMIEIGVSHNACPIDCYSLFEQLGQGLLETLYIKNSVVFYISFGRL